MNRHIGRFGVARHKFIIGFQDDVEVNEVDNNARATSRGRGRKRNARRKSVAKESSSSKKNRVILKTMIPNCTNPSFVAKILKKSEKSVKKVAVLPKKLVIVDGDYVYITVNGTRFKVDFDSNEVVEQTKIENNGKQ